MPTRKRINYGLLLLCLSLTVLAVCPVFLQEGVIRNTPEPVRILCALPQVPEQLEVYSAPQLDSDGCIALGMDLGERLGIRYDSISYKPDHTMFLGRDNSGNSHLLVIDSRTGCYTYSSPKKADIQWLSADRETVTQALAGFGIGIAPEASFLAQEEGWHSFQLNRVICGDTLLDGVLRCRYADDGTVRELEQGITAYAFETYYPSVPAEEALGLAQDTYWQEGQEILPLQLLACTLEYLPGEEGEYLPFYRFSFSQEDTDIPREILIPAIREV